MTSLDQVEFPLVDEGLFEAAIAEGVQEGVCVLIQGNKITYAGKIRTCPDVAGCLLLMHVNDFTILQQHLNRKRH